MSQWYLSQQGQATGPFDQQTIIEKIKKKEVGHLDLVFKVGNTDWVPLSKVAEFSEAFGLKEELQKDKNQPEWVLLKKVKLDKTSEFKQIGPFTLFQVIELLDQGEVRFSDFAWKKGFPTWLKISEIEEFEKPLPSSSSIDATLYEKTNTGFEIETLTRKDKENLKKEIEKFDPEATRVVTAASSPINSEEFVTESKKTKKDNDSDDIQLWSLNTPVPVAQPSSQKISSSAQKEVSEGKNKKSSEKNKAKPKRSRPQSIQPLLLATTALFLSAFFLYSSLKPDETEIIYETHQTEQRENLEDQTSNSGSTANSYGVTPQEGQTLESPQQSLGATTAQLQEKLRSLKDSVVEPTEKSVLDTRADSNQQTRSRNVAQTPTKKTMSVEKEKNKAKAQVVPKEKPSKKVTAIKGKPKASTKKVEKNKSVGSTKLTGSKKFQSYFKHRERKALFYSSIRAETLAVDIEGQFKKLKTNRSAWNRYYGQWKKKVGTSLAQEIRSYPSKNQKYAYPQILDSFKKDYQLFYKYGEVFNSKVNGKRVPADAPQDIKKIFTRYREQAKNLSL